MDISIRDFTQTDIDQITAAGLNGAAVAERRMVVEVFDDNGHTAQLYVENSTIEKLGAEYIQKNVTLEYSKTLDEWHACLSQNNFYNDTGRYPEQVIEVEYVEDMHGENTEIYRNTATGAYYMRQLSGRENFAKWLKCRKDSRYQYTDDYEVRANTIFRNGGEEEKITFDDWNGNAAYSSTFNPNFRG